jgi:sugar phosphate isomerase/epimerase
MQSRSVPLIGVVQDKICFSNAIDFLNLAHELECQWVELKYEAALDHQYGLRNEAGTKIKRLANLYGIGLSVHAPYNDGLNLGHPDRKVREKTREQMMACLEFCNIIGASYLTVHGGFYETEPNLLVGKKGRINNERISIRDLVPKSHLDELKERVLTQIDWLIGETKKLDLVVALENLHDFSNFKVRFPVTPSDFLVCKKVLGDKIQFVYDLGHGHSTLFHINEFVDKVGDDRIAGTHLHDNNQIDDEHLPVGQGTVDFRGFLTKYIQNGWKFPLNIEVKSYSDLIASIKSLRELYMETEKKVYEKRGGSY